MESYNLTHTGEQLDSAIGRALEGFAAADAATKAANDAAKLAEDTAAEVQEKLDNGEFIGPVGPSGVYVGSGEPPAGYTVQVDPTGDMVCYTAGESDSRYLRATEAEAAITDGFAAITDADDAAFSSVLLNGATAETGTGGKGPDNPYTIAGVQPAAVTACRKNLLENGKSTTTINGITFTVNPDDSVTLQGTATEKAVLYLKGAILRSGTAFTLSGNTAGWTGASLEAEITYAGGTIEYRGVSASPAYPFVTKADAITCVRVYIKVDSGTTVSEITLYPQIELGSAATPYEPYTGQTVTLPALEPLYGDRSICDEYDAATGVETRRWKRVVLDGTEAWITRTSGAGVYGYALPDVFDAPAAAGVCTHFKFIKNGASGMQTAVCVASASTQKALSVFTTIATLDDFKAWLATQATAGTPVAVLYQLAEPAVTQRGPLRIPTFPDCTNLTADAPASGSVRYPMSAPMQWDSKADKANVYDRDTADSRYANVLTGAASGPVAALEDVSPTGALRRAAVLGETRETGTGEKGLDNPYTITGTEPTTVTVRGKNLADVSNVKYIGNSSPVETFPGGFYLPGDKASTRIVHFPCGFKAGKTYVVSYQAENVGTGSPKVSMYLPALNQYLGDPGWPFVPKADTDTLGFYVDVKYVAEGVKIKISDVQAELGSIVTPYEPYNGQTIPLPALEPLYGDGTVCDEYDAASGVETRRWKRVALDGTESWTLESAESVKPNYTEFVVYGLLRGIKNHNMLVCTHYGVGTNPERISVIAKSGHTYIRDASHTTVETFKAYLAAQYAAGTPVTVVYQLEAPVVTRHDPARIIPPAPVCRVFADAGTVDVGYHRDVDIVIPKLEAALAELLGGRAQPMT